MAAFWPSYRGSTVLSKVEATIAYFSRLSQFSNSQLSPARLSWLSPVVAQRMSTCRFPVGTCNWSVICLAPVRLFPRPSRSIRHFEDLFENGCFFARTTRDWRRRNIRPWEISKTITKLILHTNVNTAKRETLGTRLDISHDITAVWMLMLPGNRKISRKPVVSFGNGCFSRN